MFIKNLAKFDMPKLERAELANLTVYITYRIKNTYSYHTVLSCKKLKQLNKFENNFEKMFEKEEKRWLHFLKILTHS